MSQEAISVNGDDMKEEDEIDNSAGYLIIIAALKARKAKLKQAESQLRNQILKLEEELLKTQDYNQSQSECNCCFVGDRSAGTRFSTHIKPNMTRPEWDVVLSTGGWSKPVTPIQSLDRYNNIHKTFL